MSCSALLLTPLGVPRTPPLSRLIPWGSWKASLPLLLSRPSASPHSRRVKLGEKPFSSRLPQLLLRLDLTWKVLWEDTASPPSATSPTGPRISYPPPSPKLLSFNYSRDKEVACVIKMCARRGFYDFYFVLFYGSNRGSRSFASHLTIRPGGREVHPAPPNTHTPLLTTANGLAPLGLGAA